MRTTGRKDSSAVPLGAKSHLASARIFRNCVVCNRNLLFVIAFPAGSKLLSDSLAQTEAVGRIRTCGERGGVVQVHSPQQLFAFVDLSLRRFSTSAAMHTTGNAHGWAKPGAPARLTGSAPAAATTMIACRIKREAGSRTSPKRRSWKRRRTGESVVMFANPADAIAAKFATLVRLTSGWDARHFQE